MKSTLTRLFAIASLCLLGSGAWAQAAHSDKEIKEDKAVVITYGATTKATTICRITGISTRVLIHVAQRMPKTICPLPPMLNSPTRNPNEMPRPAAIRGEASLKVSVKGLMAVARSSALVL
jgi:hypothetical protein